MRRLDGGSTTGAKKRTEYRLGPGMDPEEEAKEMIQLRLLIIEGVEENRSIEFFKRRYKGKTRLW